VRRVPVESAAVASVGYDPATNELEIEYAGGGVYRYYGVPPSRVEALLTAASIGRYVTEHIKPRYPYREMD
jgi:N-formylglutamate amidohydrolase